MRLLAVIFSQGIAFWGDARFWWAEGLELAPAGLVGDRDLAFSSLVAPSIAAALSALLICLFRGRIARTMMLLDAPDLRRKRHAGPTPLVAGMAAFPAIAVACIDAVSRGASDGTIALLHGIVFGFFLVGYADDRVEIKPSRRLLLTLALFGGFILVAPGLRPPAFTFGEMTVGLTEGGVALLAIAGATGAINAINMADGQDGLCIGLFLIWLVVFLYPELSDGYASACLIVACALLVALSFNLFSLVFLGDLGAYGVGGFVLSLMLVGAGEGTIDHGQIVVALTVPVMDCIWLMVERRKRGHSPYDPDRQHLHHILMYNLGRWPSLIFYLSVVTGACAASHFGGWACVAAILAQVLVVALVRGFAARVPEDAPVPDVAPPS